MSDMTLLVSLLGTQSRLQARNVARKETSPHSSHVVVMLCQIDDDHRASGLSPFEHGTGKVAHILVEGAECFYLDR